MELGSDKNPFINQSGNINPVTKVHQKPEEIKVEQSGTVSPAIKDSETDLSNYAQGTALTCFDLGLDDHIYSAEEGKTIAKKFGYDSVQSLQSNIGATQDGTLTTDTLNKLKDHLIKEKAELEKGLIKEIPVQLGVSSLAEVQKKIGVTTDGKIGPETINKLGSLLDSDSLILNIVNTKLAAQEFKAMIKVLQVNLEMTDEVLKLLDH